MRKIFAVVVALMLSACSDKESSVASPVSPNSIPAASSAPVSASSLVQTQQSESQKQEAGDIAKSESQVERSGRKLTLHLLSGKALELVDSEDCEDAENCRSYVYRGLIADKQFFWVVVGFYEGGQSLLISRKTGEQVDIVRDPHVSPDGKFIISVSDADAYDDPGVFLWEIVDSALASRFRLIPENYQVFNFTRWTDANNADLMKTAWPPKGECPEGKLAQYPMTLVKEGVNWSLKAVSEKGKCLQ